MSEKYPQAWRDACLRLLQVRREELHKALGYKRMSWEPIRNEVMRQIEYRDGSYKPDERLIRQNFDSWEKGAELKDEKFGLIDLYVRRLALSGEDTRASQILRQQEFNKKADVLSEMYTRTRDRQRFPHGLIAQFPWTLCTRELTGAWYKCIVARSVNVIPGVVEIVLAYLPAPLGSMTSADFDNTVFFEGFLIAIGHAKSKGHGGDEPDRQVCKLKLLNPTYRGLSLSGYADGEVSSIALTDDPGLNPYFTRAIIKPGMSIVSPRIYGSEDNDAAVISKPYHVERVVRSSKLPDSLTTRKLFDIDLHPVDTQHMDRADYLFSSLYRGYLL